MEDDFWNKPSSIQDSDKNAKMSESDVEKLNEIQSIMTQISQELTRAKSEVMKKLQVDGAKLNQIK